MGILLALFIGYATIFVILVGSWKASAAFVWFLLA